MQREILTPSGMKWPGFCYTVIHRDARGEVKTIENAYNLIPLEGVNYMLDATFKGVSQYTSWYLSVCETARAPVSGDTMTSLLTDCTESTKYTVTAGARPTVTFPAVVDGTLDTIDAPNVLVFTAACTIRLAFITTNVTRGSSSGMLMSAVLFPTPKVITEAGESLTIPAGFALISA